MYKVIVRDMYGRFAAMRYFKHRLSAEKFYVKVHRIFKRTELYYGKEKIQ